LSSGLFSLSSGPEESHGVFLDHAVGGDEDHVLQVGLGNEEPIKRIAMMIGESENCQGVRW
jgi:hypothetical protein